jgi:uncharacterized membrane protein
MSGSDTSELTPDGAIVSTSSDKTANELRAEKRVIIEARRESMKWWMLFAGPVVMCLGLGAAWFAFGLERGSLLVACTIIVMGLVAPLALLLEPVESKIEVARALGLSIFLAISVAGGLALVQFLGDKLASPTVTP